MATNGNINSLVFLNEGIMYLRNERILEYDIVEGGYSVGKELDLFPKKFLRKLETLTKHERHVEIGKFSINNREFTKDLYEGFKESIKLFRSENKVEDDNVLSIKKDSITLYNSDIKHQKFGNVLFTLRESATSYLLLNKIEFYYDSKNKKNRYKGLPEGFGEDDMVNEIFDILGMSEYKKKSQLFEYLKELREAYVTKELFLSYYRELNANASYSMKQRFGGFSIFSESIDDDSLDELDISFNYEKYLVPLISIFV